MTDVFNHLDLLTHPKVEGTMDHIRSKYAILLSAHGESKAQEYLGKILSDADLFEEHYLQTKYAPKITYKQWYKKQNQYVWACPSTGSSVVSGGKVSPR